MYHLLSVIQSPPQLSSLFLSLRFQLGTYLSLVLLLYYLWCLSILYRTLVVFPGRLLCHKCSEASYQELVAIFAYSSQFGKYGAYKLEHSCRVILISIFIKIANFCQPSIALTYDLESRNI